ncbi:MAG: YihY/virulence factor BrkB family protein [Candidatus Sulfotelmatobacter sp.]
MRWTEIKPAFKNAIQDVQDHHTLQVAAALSYYFFLALFPGLIVLSALLSSIPLPDLFGWVLVTMARLLPQETMRLVYSILADVLSAHRGAWLSVGMLGMIWVASAAFDALIEALNIAYDIKDDRPFWKTRLLALGLAGICGGLFLGGLAVIMVGPRFGGWLASRMDVPKAFAALWPIAHWTIAVTFTILAVELLYFLAPRIRPRFVDTLPGAILTVGAWLALSSLLGVYFRQFANYGRTYGTLGGFIAFMTWLQWTSFALLVGAEINTELAKARRLTNEEKDLLAEKMHTIETPNRAA